MRLEGEIIRDYRIVRVRSSFNLLKTYMTRGYRKFQELICCLPNGNLSQYHL